MTFYSYHPHQDKRKASLVFRPATRSESEATSPSSRLQDAARFQDRERSVSSVDLASAASLSSSIPQQQQHPQQRQLQPQQQHHHLQPQQPSRARRSGSAAPKCFFYEGEQYSSFAYWREPLVNMDDEIAGLAEAMKL